jgi:hypothetical protein
MFSTRHSIVPYRWYYKYIRKGVKEFTEGEEVRWIVKDDEICKNTQILGLPKLRRKKPVRDLPSREAIADNFDHKKKKRHAWFPLATVDYYP